MTRPTLSLVVVAGVLAGCGHSPPTRFFTLDPLGPEPASVVVAPYRGPALRVEAVHIPPAMNRPEMIRESSADEIRVDDFAQWAAPLGETARRTLTQDLAARLPAGVVIYPDAPRPAGSVGLVVDILAFSEAADQGVLDASWTLVPTASAATTGPAHVVRLTEPRSGPGPQGDAAVLSRLLARLADRIVADPTL